MPKTAKQNDPLAARPQVPENVVEREDEQGLIELQREIPVKGRMMGWFRRKMGLHYTKRVSLDQHGTFFWRKVDGRRSLRRIARDLEKEYDVSEREAKDAVVAFTKMLMMRGLLSLHVEGVSTEVMNKAMKAAR